MADPRTCFQFKSGNDFCVSFWPKNWVRKWPRLCFRVCGRTRLDMCGHFLTSILGQFLTQIWGRFLTQKFAAAHTFCVRKWTPVGSGSGCSRESDLAWVGLCSAYLKLAEFGWAGLNCYGLRIGWVGFEYAGLDWSVLRSVWLGWPVYAFKFSANLWSLHWLLDALSFSNVQPLTSL